MLRFVNDDRLVIVDGTARVVDLARGGEHELDIAAERVIDVAGFADQIWVAERDAAGGAALVRLGLDGRRLAGPALPLPSAVGRWVAGSLSVCAVWNGPSPAIASVAPAVALAPIAERADLIVPYSAARFALVQGAKVALRTAGGVRWTSAVLESLRVEDGAFLYDGSSLALVAAGAGGARTLVVLTTRDGVAQQRLSVAGAVAVQLAPRRGQALVQIGERRLLLLDLRFARAVADHEHDKPIEAIAINASATGLAIVTRDADGGRVLTHWTPRDLMAGIAGGSDGRSAPPVVAAPPDPEPASEPAAAPPGMIEPAAAAAEPSGQATATVAASGAASEAATTPAAAAQLAHSAASVPPSAPAAPQPGFDLVDPPLLAPRSRAARTDAAQARALLDHERGVIAARCFVATAQAWDQGRIVWDSESEHPYETELMGLLERQRGRAVDRTAGAIGALADREAALAAARAATTALAPLDELARELELSPLARRMLLVIAAPTIWGEIARMYGILANDSARAIVDEMLVRQVLGDSADVHDIARELDVDRPLVRRGAVRVGAGSMRPFLALHVDPLVIRRLRGDALGDGADPGLRIVAATRSIDRLLLPAGVLDRLREALAAAPTAPTAPLRLVVRGRSGAGRLSLIAALGDTANRSVAVIDAAPLVRDGRIRGDELALRIQRAALGGWLPCVDNLDVIGHDDRGAREQLREIFRSHPGPLALRLGSDVTPPLDPGYLAIDLPPLSETQRLAAWKVALAERGLAFPDVEDLASRWVIGPGTVHRVLDQLTARGGATGEPAEVLGRLDGLIRQHLESRLGDLATRVTRLASWSQIVLPADVLDSLLELVARIRHRRTVFERWGFDRVMASSRGLTALFQGGPGTGKTMVASAIARELGLDVYRVDLSRIVSKWIGETERNLAQLFDAAEDGQAIILFDEADSLFARRTEVKSSVDRYANLEVNYLLQRLDSFAGIAILTTNFGGAIDTAFKRRLSFRLSFPFPDDDMREQLWRVHLPPGVPRAGELDLAELARKYKMSGGYIRNAALRAAFLAAAEESGLRHDHLERAVRLEYREIGKLAETGALE